MIEKTLDSRYYVQKLLGEGGFGSVYRAFDQNLRREVAVKILNFDARKDPKQGERFLIEAQITSQLQHKNVLRLYDFGQTEEGEFYIVSELLDGASLEVVLDCYPLSIPQTFNVLRQVTEALDIAHQHNIIHRDVKPPNVFIHTTRGYEEIKLLDFGIAKVGGEDNSTITGELFGTPYYMSPEQIYGSKSVSKATDIYSLGILAFHCLTGQVPFDGESQYIIFNKHIKEPVPLLSKFSPAFDKPQLQSLIESMMAKKPKDRPQDGSEIIKALDDLKAISPEWFTTAQPLLSKEVPTNRGGTQSVQLSNLNTSRAVRISPGHQEPPPFSSHQKSAAQDDLLRDQPTLITVDPTLSTAPKESPVKPSNEVIADQSLVRASSQETALRLDPLSNPPSSSADKAQRGRVEVTQVRSTSSSQANKPLQRPRQSILLAVEETATISTVRGTSAMKLSLKRWALNAPKTLLISAIAILLGTLSFLFIDHAPSPTTLSGDSPSPQGTSARSADSSKKSDPLPPPQTIQHTLALPITASNLKKLNERATPILYPPDLKGLKPSSTAKSALTKKARLKDQSTRGHTDTDPYSTLKKSKKRRALKKQKSPKQKRLLQKIEPLKSQKKSVKTPGKKNPSPSASSKKAKRPKRSKKTKAQAPARIKLTLSPRLKSYHPSQRIKVSATIKSKKGKTLKSKTTLKLMRGSPRGTAKTISQNFIQPGMGTWYLQACVEKLCSRPKRVIVNDPMFIP